MPSDLSYTPEEREKVYLDAIATWGVDAQVDMLVEELAECIVATQKLFKRDFSFKRLKDLAGEIADVTIMVEEILVILDKVAKLPQDTPEGSQSFSEMVDDAIEFKIGRTADRIVSYKAALSAMIF